MYRVTKLFRLSDGGVLSAAGAWGKAYAAVQWFLGGQEGDCPDFEGASLIWMRPDGVIWIADEEMPGYPLLSKFAAIGSGAQGAMTAMYAGKSAKEAVEAVTSADRNTSGPVQVMAVKLAEKRKRK